MSFVPTLYVKFGCPLFLPLMQGSSAHILATFNFFPSSLNHPFHRTKPCLRVLISRSPISKLLTLPPLVELQAPRPSNDSHAPPLRWLRPTPPPDVVHGQPILERPRRVTVRELRPCPRLRRAIRADARQRQIQRLLKLHCSNREFGVPFRRGCFSLGCQGLVRLWPATWPSVRHQVVQDRLRLLR